MTQRYAYFAVALLSVSLTLGSSRLEAQERPAISLDQITQLLGSGVFPDERIVFLASQNCLGFQLNDETIRGLERAGASDSLIADLREVCVKLLVRVDPAELDLLVDSTSIIQVEALSLDSIVVPSVVFRWSSADTSVAEVNSGGLVLAKALGETEVKASIDDSLFATASVSVVEAFAEVDSLVLPPGAKSIGTAAALGIIPGGGEFYVGNTTKGVIVLGGAAAALAAGFLLSSEDTLSVTRELLIPETCTGSACRYEVRTTADVEEKNYVIVGAAVAGAFWLYGFVDGILTAKKSRQPVSSQLQQNGQGLSLQIAPPDGVRVGSSGRVELTFVRIRS